VRPRPTGVAPRALLVAAGALAAWLLPSPAAPAASYAVATPCDWPMYGHDPTRAFSSACPTAPLPSTALSMHLRWAVPTADDVTAVPSVAGGVAYVGTWDGTFYALDAHSGGAIWTTVLGSRRAAGQADHHAGAYGEITSTAAIDTVGGRRLAFVGAGGSVYAVDARSQSLPDAQRVVWRFDTDPAHPTGLAEVESSPVVWDGAAGGPEVIVGADANQSAGFAGEGVWALDAAGGRIRWHFNPESLLGRPLFGCGNVWSSPALALDPAAGAPSRRAMVIVGMADCPDNGATACPADGSDPHCPPGQAYDPAKRWQPYSEAIVALDARDGRPLWSFQPHPPLSADDDDFGASPQLFTLPGGRHVVGEGNKDGAYYVLDVATGALVWQLVEQGNGNIQRGFAIGGFFGTPAVGSAGGAPVVAGASAIDTPVAAGPDGSMHLQGAPLEGLTPMRGFSGVDGAPMWNSVQAPGYGSSSTARGVVWSGALDGLVRAQELATGRLLWAAPLDGPMASGVAVTDGEILVGAGISDSDAFFKACSRLPVALQRTCESTPLNTTINPLGRLAGIFAFGV
jgi:polyvinyl alcohol dehydrogenase (cytochrome)